MASESKEDSSMDKLTECIATSQSVDAEVAKYAVTMEFSPALGRPDRLTTIRQIDGTSLEDFVVRVSEINNHVLVMGSPCCPTRCDALSGEMRLNPGLYATVFKAHLQSMHKLDHVQVNLACPCPGVCNVINGEPRECHAVMCDPVDGVLQTHMQDKHPTYFHTMEHSLCIRKEKEENIDDVPEEVKNYVQYLDSGKKLSAWTREDPQRSPMLFPSQIFPEEVILPTVVKYTCPIPPCRGDQVMVPYAMSMHLLHEPGHQERMGWGKLIFERCPKYDFNVQWSGRKMLLHVRAMQPEMLGEPDNFSEAAKAGLAKLVGQIKGKIIGRAIGDTSKPGDGTNAHYLYSFRCHIPNGKKVFSERDHLEWHIKADHQQKWNK